MGHTDDTEETINFMNSSQLAPLFNQLAPQVKKLFPTRPPCED